MCLCSELQLESLNKLGLSDSGFTSHYNDLSNAILHKVPVIRQQVELPSAANQRSDESRLDNRIIPLLSFNHAKQPQSTDVFQFVNAEILVAKRVRRQQALGGFGYDERVRAGRGLNSAGNIWRLSNDELVHYHLTRIHANTQMEFDIVFLLEIDVEVPDGFDHL